MKFFASFILIICFIKCSSVKFEKKPPFTITSAEYFDWVGNVKGVSGTNVNLYYTSNSKIDFIYIYFKDKKTKAEYKQDNKGKLIVGYFNDSKQVLNNDIQLHNDPKKEYGNNVPIQILKSLFNLKNNEAVISFKDGNKIKYYKIKNIKKGKNPYYPQTR